MNTNNPIIEVELSDDKILTVVRTGETYDVAIDNFVRHTACTHEDVFRVLGHYIQAISYDLKKSR